MTLLEMTVVILVLLVLISVTFIGARVWKRSSDRAMCIMRIEEVQKAVRSYSNLYGYSPGDSVPDLKAQIIGLGRFIETTPVCPGSGVYQYGQAFGINTVPPIGTPYVECSLAASDEHAAADSTQW